MSTYISAPGTRLAGRYRLEDQVGGGSGWTLWKAIDEILARPVTVLVFAEGFPRVNEAVTAARAASRLTDSRLCRVFDVDDSGEQAYVVTEWVTGDSLDDLLAEGPLDTGRAIDLVAEAARALAVAHEAGLAHLRLSPRSLRWTRGGGVKITGLGIDAVLAEPVADDGDGDPALIDTRGLAKLLYAAVTGYWPGPEPTALPAAPTLDGAPCSPRQVSAAVPVSVDSVACRALFQRHGRGSAAIATPLAFADALAGIAPVAPPVIPALPGPGGDRAGHRRHRHATDCRGADRRTGERTDVWTGAGTPTAEHPATGRIGAGRRADRGAGGGFKALAGVVAVLVLAAIGATAWLVSHQSPHPAGHRASPTRSATPSTAASVVLKPVGAQGFDNNGEAQDAIDGNPATDWHTDYYIGNPVFGGLKTGTGLLLDMGSQVRLSQVTIQFGSVCCADVQLGIGNSAAADPAAYTTVANSTSAAGTTTFHVTSRAAGRYVLIWFTRLPQKAGTPNEYEAQIYNVVVRGTG